MTNDPASRAASIELSIDRLAQLFDSLDPSPFREKSLDPDAHRYLLACARELAHAPALRILVHAARGLHDKTEIVTEGIRHHFRLEAEQAGRELRARMRAGRMALLRGLLLLVACTLLRGLLPHDSGLAWLGEGLQIFGWVAMWRPVEVLLYEHWEGADERRALQRLATAGIEFRFRDLSRD